MRSAVGCETNNGMRNLIILVCVLLSNAVYAQTDTSKWLRAFPITDYIVVLNDSVKVVQLEMPDGSILKDKQLGLMYGVYNTSRDETVQKGYGKCHLIKGVYYYFTIGHNESGQDLKKGDLLYTFMDRTNIYYGLIPKLAGHFIRLQNVYGQPFYDRYTIFLNWSEKDEQQVLDSLIADINFTGKYFMDNDPSMNQLITSGAYEGKKTLSVMISCKDDDIKKFLEFVIARPRSYAGKEWKVSEIFATWLINGAPGP